MTIRAYNKYGFPTHIADIMNDLSKGNNEPLGLDWGALDKTKGAVAINGEQELMENKIDLFKLLIEDIEKKRRLN